MDTDHIKEEVDALFTDEKLVIGVLSGEPGSPVFVNNEMEVPRLKNQIVNLVANVAGGLRSHDQEELTRLVEGMKKKEMVFGRKLTEGGGHPDYKAIEYNRALSDLTAAIRSYYSK